VLFLTISFSSHVPQVYNKIGKYWNAKGARDIPYSGNTGEIQHLLSKRDGASPRRDQISFECGLRGYQGKCAVKHETTFDSRPKYAKHDPLGKVTEKTHRIPVFSVADTQLIAAPTQATPFSQGNQDQEPE